MPAWLEEEGLPSGDEALAWLGQLAEGREEELHAQAAAEGEARMAEIMGRPSVEEPPAAEIASGEAEAADQGLSRSTSSAPPEPPTVAGEPLPMGETSGPAEAVSPPARLEGEGPPSGDEALAWLQQLAEGPEAELRAPAAAEGEARIAETMGRPAAEEPFPAEIALGEAKGAADEEPFGWTTFAPLELPAPAGAAGVAVPSVVLDEADSELREEAEMEVLNAPQVSPATELPAVAEGAQQLAGKVMPATPPEEEVAAVTTAAQRPELPGEAPPSPAGLPSVAGEEPFAAERAHLREHPRDRQAWLSLARALWQAGDRQEALRAYARVIHSGDLIESVVADLEEYVAQWPDVGTWQLLGDAHMRGGRLQDALDTYRRALNTL